MPTFANKGIYAKKIGNAGDPPFTTVTLGTGMALDNHTRFLPLRLRVHVVGMTGNWIYLDAADPNVWEFWENANGAWSQARNARYLFDLQGAASLPVAEGMLCSTATSYDVADILSLPPGGQVDCIFFELCMFG